MERSLLRWNGWGKYDAPDVLGEKAEGIWAWMGEHMRVGALPITPAQPLESLTAPPSGLTKEQRERLEALLPSDRLKTNTYERAWHARGRSYHDLLHLRAGNLETAPDAVVYPETETEAQALVRLAAESGLTLIPFGGGSSVVGGVTPARAEGPPTVTVDMTRMNHILEVDMVAMTARVEAGIYGPDLEAGLKTRGVTLGHYPQSFEYSTLGGWIAARGAGHQSLRYGKAEDWFLAARLATPQGLWITETFPKSAAGPLLRDLVPGSEGVFGIITEAWIRLHTQPVARDYSAWILPDFESGIHAVRELMQAGLPLATLRLSDVNETFFYAVLHGGAEVGYAGPLGFCLMLMGLEGEAREVEYARAQAQPILQKRGGACMGSSLGEIWLRTRFDTPYLRDPMLDRGLGVDTVETAVSWGRLPVLHARVSEAIDAEITRRPGCPGARGMVMAHISHSYRDGASLYFTFVFPRDPEDAIGQWRAIKQAATRAILDAGGTLSHHHGVGTDHLPWMREEKGAAYALLRSVKQALDPRGLLNPGKLVE